MKKKNINIACVLSAVSLLAFALVACETENLSAPTGTLSNGEVQSSSCCEGIPESSSETVSSSETGVDYSSSAAIASSSSERVWCVDIQQMCSPCKGDDCPSTPIPCSSCREWSIGQEALQCKTREIYICNQYFSWSATGLYEGYLEEMATDVKAERRDGSAATPHVLKVVNADSSVTFRDDGIRIFNGFVVDGVKGILSGDTVNVKILYPDSAYNVPSEQGVLTFTLGKAFANVKRFKYLESTAKAVFEEGKSSSSVAVSSSSWKVGCITMSELCPPCDGDDCPIPFMPCNQCYGMCRSSHWRRFLFLRSICRNSIKNCSDTSNSWDLPCPSLKLIKYLVPLSVDSSRSVYALTLYAIPLASCKK